jgi:uncharacterized protein YukE
MAIELPQPVVDFLNLIGVDFPQINEDAVRAFGAHVKEFAQNVQSTHSAATGTVQQLGSAYQGASYELLVSRWTEMSSSHMTELVEVCNGLATAMDVAADFIVGKKIEAIAQFAVMAAEFVADQAASIVTLGLAEAAEVAIVAAARELSDFLEQELEQYLIGEVLQKALPPLMEVVQKAVGGLVYSAVGDALGEGGGAARVGPMFSVDPDQLSSQANVFDQHAAEIEGHAQTLSSNLKSLNFNS